MINNIKKNPINYAMGAAFIVSILFNLPNMISDRADNQKLRDKANAIELAAASRAIERDAARAEIEEGCAIALDEKDRSKYADIRNGVEVKVADGTRVCSRKGEFGIVKNGKLTGVISAGQPKELKEYAIRTYSGSVLIKRNQGE